MYGLGSCACDANNDYAVCSDGSTCIPNGTSGSWSCGLLQLMGPVGPLANLVGACPGFAPNPAGDPANLVPSAANVATGGFCGSGSYQWISGIDNCLLLLGIGIGVFVLNSLGGRR
jgi:hypothetical protein